MITFTLLLIAAIGFVACVLTFVGVFWFVVADVVVFCLTVYGLYKLLSKK